MANMSTENKGNEDMKNVAKGVVCVSNFFIKCKVISGPKLRKQKSEKIHRKKSCFI